MTSTSQLDTGLSYAQNTQYDDAVKEFTSLITQDQTYADAFFYRGCAHLHLGEYQKTIDDFNCAISSSNFSTRHELSALYKRGYAYIKINQFDSALDDYRHYINQCKSQEDEHLIHKGYFQMGVIYAALNEYNSAISNFTNAIEQSRDTEEAKQMLYYLHRGRAYACYAKYDKAQADLELVIEQSKDLFIQGCAYNELGRHEDALRAFDSLLQSKLTQTLNDHILFRRGLSYACLNLHVQALSDFEYALNYSRQKQSSSNIADRIYFRKGMSNMALNGPYKALIDLNDSTKLNDKQSDVFYARGMLHYTLGRHNAAVYDQRKAIELERKSLSTVPAYKTIYYTNKYGANHNLYVYYDNKIRESKELLKKNKDIRKEVDIHRRTAEYLQKQASYSNDPLTSYQSAREHMKNALKLSNESDMADRIVLAINSFNKSQYLADKYSNGNMPNSAVEEYIKCAAESIVDMSKLFDKCVTKKNWHELTEKLNSLLDRSNIQEVSSFDEIRRMYIHNQLEKSEMIQKTMDIFADSPVQKEFYGHLVIRLCNLFDGIRMSSTKIFSHSLEGSFTIVANFFKMLGKIFEYVPIGSQYGSTVFGLCQIGFKKLDEIRIQNTLDHIGNLGNQKILNETANTIATELTIIYEKQIKRFPTKLEKDAIDAANNNNPQEPALCTNWCKPCSHYVQRQKERLSNAPDYSIVQKIVECGVGLLISCLVSLHVKDISTTTDVQNVFINGVCRLSSMTVFRIRTFDDKVEPKDAKNEDERWNVYDFFRRPAIHFKNGKKRAQKETDEKKFDCRKATPQEEELFENKPEEFKKYGFETNANIQQDT